jgi:predicted RNase H-like nuclease (RuvC/YqgF family)
MEQYKTDPDALPTVAPAVSKDSDKEIQQRVARLETQLAEQAETIKNLERRLRKMDNNLRLADLKRP